MHAIKRFEPEKGFRLPPMRCGGIKAAIQEYILRSWSLEDGHHRQPEEAVLQPRKAKSKISALGGRPAPRPGPAHRQAARRHRAGRGRHEPRLGGDVSQCPDREDGDSGEWQDWLVDDASDQEERLAESEESDNAARALGEALWCSMSASAASSRRAAGRRPITLEDLAAEFGVSRERVRRSRRAFQKVQSTVQRRSLPWSGRKRWRRTEGHFPLLDGCSDCHDPARFVRRP
jgi:RNA polymerase sigma-32 factor